MFNMIIWIRDNFFLCTLAHIFFFFYAHWHMDEMEIRQNKGKFTKNNCGCFSGSSFIRRSLR